MKNQILGWLDNWLMESRDRKTFLNGTNQIITKNLEKK